MQYLSLPPGPTRFLFPSPQSLYNTKGSLSSDDGDVYENVVSAASNFIALIPSRLLSQMLVNFLELDSKGLYQSSRKEKETCCFGFPSSTKREIRHFHVVVVQRWLRNVQKSLVHMQSCCFANLNLFLFCGSRCRRRGRRRLCLSSLKKLLGRREPTYYRAILCSYRK